jgi:thiamine-monophosphate kinase
MTEKNVNSEFDLITEITKDFSAYHNVTSGIGDDAAVIPKADGGYRLLAADALVENDHFNRKWSSPQEIGQKAIEVNISDIAAMGGEPEFALISLVLSRDIPQNWVRQLYEGIRATCEKYRITLVGGDTTHGPVAMISVGMTGTVAANNLTLRSSAKPSDIICVTGQVGGSAAGYFSLKNNKEISAYLRQRHCTPVARLDAAKTIAPYASAMIDVSDGVASETKHIARQSGCGALVVAESLPIHADVFAAEQELGLRHYTCALSGGEDFELLFTVSPKDYISLKKEFTDFTKIGIITSEKDVFSLVENNRSHPLLNGYDHLKPI